MTDPTTGEQQPGELRAQLEKSQRIEAWLYDSCNGAQAPHETRVIMAASSYQLAMDHHRAIIKLVSEGMPASALALLRPLVEAYTLGLWLHYCAKEAHFQQIIDHKFTKDLSALQRDLDKIGFFGSSIEKDMRIAVKNMHGFTHGGILHFQWRFKDGEVRPGYPDDMVADLLQFADIHAYLAVQGVIALGGDNAKALSLQSKVHEMFGWTKPVETLPFQGP